MWSHTFYAPKMYNPGGNMEANNLTLSSVEKGAPVDLYMFFLLRLCYEFYSTLDPTQKGAVVAKTASLVSFLPDRAARDQIWEEFLVEKESEAGVLTASVHAVGNCVSYLNEVMDLTKVTWSGII